MRTIHLYDSLKELAGVDTIQLDVHTPTELFNGLFSQVKGFQKHVRDKEIVVLLTNEDKSEYEYVTYSNFQANLGKLEHVHLAPVIEGSGFEIAGYILGAAAVGTAAYVALGIVISIAISFVTSAIVKALAPAPSGGQGSVAAATNPSFIFNGAELVYEQGYPIPLVYGCHTTGGIVIYTDVSVEDIPYIPAPITPVTHPEPMPYQWMGD